MREETVRGARSVVETLAARLRDPDAVPHRSDTDRTDMASVSRTELGTFGRGHSGISLLFSTRSGMTTEDVVTVHRHLSRCAHIVSQTLSPISGMHGHITGLGLAMIAAQASTGGYEKALRQTDAHVARTARALCAATDTGPPHALEHFDVISGLTGVGRYLLLRGESMADTLGEILETLARAALRGSGGEEKASPPGQLPGFWASGPPSARHPEDSDLARHGHLNLGLAHGIPGPLALLSLAHEQGFGSDRQSEAVERLAGLLGTWLDQDEYGPFWPCYVSRGEFELKKRHRHQRLVRWCYGSPGVSRALQLAGSSHRRNDWLAVADASIKALLAVPRHQWGVRDMGLCHGWAGVLHVLGYFADGAIADSVVGARREIAQIIVDGFDESHPFGYRVAFEGDVPGGDYPGFLEGATGIALALDSYASGKQRFPWDAALLTG